MDMFMPSEVARLVLGYLREMDCIRTIRVYLTENQSLSEYVSCLRQGQEYPTAIGGKTLIDILQDYCLLKAERDLIDVHKRACSRMRFLTANGHIQSDNLSPSISNQSSPGHWESARISMLPSPNDQDFHETAKIKEPSQVSATAQRHNCIDSQPRQSISADGCTQTDVIVTAEKGTQFPLPDVAGGTGSYSQSVLPGLDAARHPPGTPPRLMEIPSLVFGSPPDLAPCYVGHTVPICSSLELGPGLSPLGFEDCQTPQKVACTTETATRDKCSRRKSPKPHRNVSCATILPSPLVHLPSPQIHGTAANDTNARDSNAPKNLVDAISVIATTHDNNEDGSSVVDDLSSGSLLSSDSLANRNVQLQVEQVPNAPSDIAAGEFGHIVEAVSNKQVAIARHPDSQIYVLCSNVFPTQIVASQSPMPTIIASMPTIATDFVPPANTAVSAGPQVVQALGRSGFSKNATVKFLPGSAEYAYVQSTLDLLKKRNVTSLHKKQNPNANSGGPRCKKKKMVAAKVITTL